MRVAKESGFAGFEIDLSNEGPIHLASSGAELVAIRKLADKFGLILSGLATGLYWEMNPVADDSSIRDKAASILQRQIETAAVLGIEAILVVPGSVGVDFIPGSEITAYDQAWSRAITFIQGGVASAKRERVKIGIENVWNKFLLSPLEMRNFINTIGSEWIGAYFDVGNALAFGYPEQWISILGSRLVRVHFKDYRRSVGGLDGFCDLLSGDVDWLAVTQALRSAGYENWCAAEMILSPGAYRHAPEVLIENTARAMDAILALPERRNL